MRCENCGRELPPHTSSCRYCGWSMFEKKEEKKSISGALIKAGLSFLAVFAAIVFIYNIIGGGSYVSQSMRIRAKECIKITDQYLDGDVGLVDFALEVEKIYDNAAPNSNYSRDEFVASYIHDLLFDAEYGTKEDIENDLDNLKKIIR